MSVDTNLGWSNVNADYLIESEFQSGLGIHGI